MYEKFGGFGSELPFSTIVSLLKEACAVLLPPSEPAHPCQAPSPALGQNHSRSTVFCSS